MDTKLDCKACSLSTMLEKSLCVDESSRLLSPTDPLCTRYMEFVCKNRAQCLFQSLVCDGIKHCEDGSDEDTEYAGCGKDYLIPLIPFSPFVSYPLIPACNT